MRIRKTLLVLCVASALCNGTSCTTSGAIRDVPDGVVRVACVGDSITYGMFVASRKENSYPARLQRLLGDGYAVRNYGVRGYAMLRTSDKPYWEHRYFQESQEFAPDIVLIMLGTNDSKRRNWTDMSAYINDYRDMIAVYQALPSRPEVYLLTPPAAYGDDGPHRLHYHMDRTLIREMGDAVKLLGRTLGLTVIDIYEVTEGHPEYYAWDGIHPNADGAEAIATAVYEACALRFAAKQ